MMKKYQPTDSELEILQVLWEHGPSTVRFVNEQLNTKRQVVYTTTLKLMQIMTEKGLLVRDKEKMTHIYESKIPKSQVQQDLVDSFLNKVFKGSTASLMMHALGSSAPTQEELEKIKKMITDLEQQKDDLK